MNSPFPPSQARETLSRNIAHLVAVSEQAALQQGDQAMRAASKEQATLVRAKHFMAWYERNAQPWLGLKPAQVEQIRQTFLHDDLSAKKLERSAEDYQQARMQELQQELSALHQVLNDRVAALSSVTGLAFNARKLKAGFVAYRRRPQAVLKRAQANQPLVSFAQGRSLSPDQHMHLQVAYEGMEYPSDTLFARLSADETAYQSFMTHLGDIANLIDGIVRREDEVLQLQGGVAANHNHGPSSRLQRRQPQGKPPVRPGRS